MSRGADILDRLDDRLNPIVIKELRQAVRAHGLLALLGLFLIGELVAMGLSLERSAGTAAWDAGARAFTVLYGALMLTSMVFVPLYCGVRAAGERAKDADSLLMTPLSPWSLVAGKLLSGVVIVLLIYGVSAPFIVFTYLLRGIGLPAILWALAIGLAASTVMIQVGIFIGSLPTHPAAKGLLGLLVLGAMAGVVAPSPLGLPYTVLSGAPSLPVGLFVLSLFLSIAGHFCVWTGALLSPASSNWAFPIRAFSTGAWFVTSVFAFVAGWGAILAWGVLSTLSFCTALFVAVSEPLGIGRRVRREMCGQRWRRLASPLSTCVGHGIGWAWLMEGLTVFVLFFATAAAASVLAVGVALLVAAFFWFGAFGAAMTAFLVRCNATGRFRSSRTGVLGAAIWLASFLLVPVVTPLPYIALTVLWSLIAGIASLQQQDRGWEPSMRRTAGGISASGGAFPHAQAGRPAGFRLPTQGTPAPALPPGAPAVPAAVPPRPMHHGPRAERTP